MAAGANAVANPRGVQRSGLRHSGRSGRRRACSSLSAPTPRMSLVSDSVGTCVADTWTLRLANNEHVVCAVIMGLWPAASAAGHSQESANGRGAGAGAPVVCWPGAAGRYARRVGSRRLGDVALVVQKYGGSSVESAERI